MAIDPKDLWKRKIGRALKKPGNVITGAVSLAASAALWNPLPLILWGLGATAYTFFRAGGDGLEKELKAEESAAKKRQIAAEREALRQHVESALVQSPASEWIQAARIPDYRGIFRRLAGARGRVADLLAQRDTQDAFSGTPILEQLDYLLTVFLSFVRERLAYLQILQHFRAANDGGAPPPRVLDVRSRSVRVPPPPVLPDFEDKLAEIDRRVAELRELAKAEPATARTREWHVGILEKKRELLLDCQKRDQYVEAQLAAFPDVFDVIVGRVGASQFSAGEVASYMGAVVEQVEESERFVASLKPAMDELIGGFEGSGVPSGQRIFS
jgi:hypothetical protein